MDDGLKREDFFDNKLVMIREELIDEFHDTHMKEFVIKEMLGKVFTAIDMRETSYDINYKECGVYKLKETGNLLYLRYGKTLARVGGSMLREVKGKFVDAEEVDLYE